MKKIQTIDHKLKSFLYLLIVLTIIILASTMVIQLKEIANQISKDYAVLYSQEMVGKIDSQMNKEIGLSINATKNQTILNWIKMKIMKN